MGIDYSFWLDIGYKIDSSSLPESMLKVTEEKFHMEDRFDQRTGKQLPPVKVVDEEGGETTYVVDGTELEDTYELAEALAEKLGCEVECEHGYSGEDFALTFSLNLPRTNEDDGDWGRVSAGSSILFEEATSSKAQAAMKKLAEDLKALGIEPGPAKIMIGRSVG